MKMKRATLGLLVTWACAGACASSSKAWTPPSQQDTRDDPAVVRPGFGNVELHTWWPLAATEVAALQGLPQARGGDARALLALALLASGGERDLAGYSSHQRRLEQFTAEVKPSVDEATDDWHRGYALNRAMHRLLFRGAETELGGYDFNQPRVSSIFTTGRYNCLSSAMLYVVIARSFALPVRAAMLPTHVFVELGPPGGKIIEVETTSATGFDWVHDERFYREQAAEWSSRRGLRPTTLDDYRRRTILEPHQLVARAMLNAYAGEGQQDRARRNELAGVIDPDDAQMRRSRVRAYVAEAHDLDELKAWRTTVKMFDVVTPALVELRTKSTDAETLEMLSWAGWFNADALMVVGRQEDAMTLVADGLSRLDAAWPDAEKLRTNYVAVLDSRMGELTLKHDFPAAEKVFTRYREPCLARSTCADNAVILYRNWSITHQNAGDWQSARRVLQQCVAELGVGKACADDLRDLESQHRF
jgi:hypothetical protein